MRDWLWLMCGWNLLTGMPDSEKGVATAMSLGGRGAKIARAIDYNILQQPWGLAYLIQKLEQDLGSESQERQKYALEAYNNLQRSRNTSYQDHIVNFEIVLEEAEKAGAMFNNVMKSNHLLKTCRLSRLDEQWVLQPVSGDLSQYAAIRAALRRCPFHSEPGHQSQERRGAEAYAAQKHDAVPFNMSQQGHLNAPPLESNSRTSHAVASSQEQSLPEDQESCSSGEDFFDSDSDADSDSAMTWGAAWAVHKKNFKKFNKDRPKMF